MNLTIEHIVALSIFSSYFLLIFGLFYLIVSSIRKYSTSPAYPGRVWLFNALTVVSFGHTWFWMFKYMLWSFSNFESKQTLAEITQKGPLLRVANWLTKTGLFEEAWLAVCKSPLNWWWSEQLCLFTTGAFTVFLFMQQRVPHIWAYMLLGQVVAISVAWSLLNVALVVLPPSSHASERPTLRLPLLVTVPVVLSLLTVSLSPYTSTSTFLPNLLIMHALLIIPLLPLPQFAVRSLSPRASSFYTLIALLSITLRIRTTAKLLSFLRITSSPFFSLSYPTWKTLHSHPAQASIGWDIVWTCVVLFGWGLFGHRDQEETRWKIADGGLSRCVLATVVASLGVVAPMEFGREMREDAETRSKME
ncbi:hypothetical protein BU17DRAFT_41834 [Hysterangium stoloniferum]|nr:hypothetical protein BU17DRAFT_41834 [Hysterangium stoloniferum]